MLFISSPAALSAQTGSLSEPGPHEIIFPGLSGNQLLDSLAVHYRPEFVYNYDDARDLMFTFTDNNNDQVICVYTGDVLHIPADAENPRADFANPANWNTEHIWPQSKGALEGTARRDLHHLRSIRADVNTSRSNHPFAFLEPEEVSRWWKDDGNQTATPDGDLEEWSRTGNQLFQVRDAEMGDVARAMFYFYTIYRAESHAADPAYFTQMQDVLRSYHNQDTVDTVETERNLRIESLQGNHNPFVTDTTLVRRAFFENFNPDEGWYPRGYFVDFETGTKGSYGTQNTDLNGIEWTFDNALLGSDGGDVFIGSRSARMRVPGEIFMIADKENGLGTVSFLYARSNFTGDRTGTAPVIVVEYSTNQGNSWTQAGSEINLNGVDELTRFSIPVNDVANGRVRIRTVGGTADRRFNIDDFHITDVTDQPVLSVNPSEIQELSYTRDEGPSASKAFEITGSNLDGSDVTINAPDNFEISTDDQSFTASSVLPSFTDGLETLYIRLSEGLEGGDYSGNVSISGGGAADIALAVSGEVTEPVLVLYEFTGDLPTASQKADKTTVTELEISSGNITYGTTGTWSGSGVPYAQGNSGWGESSIETAKNFSFLLSPDYGYGLTLSRLSFEWRTTGAGPAAITVEINGRHIKTISSGSNEQNIFSVSLEDFDDQPFAEVKIKGWDNGSRVTSGGGDFRINDVRLDGDLSPSMYFGLSGTNKTHQNSGFRFLASPVSTTLGSFLSRIWTQGQAGSDHPGSSHSNLFKFDGTVYQPLGSETDLTTEVLERGDNLVAYIFELDVHNDPGSSIWPKVFPVYGDAPEDNFTFGQAAFLNTAADAYSLIGNPFARTIMLNDFADVTTDGLLEQVWVYDHSYSSGFDDGGTESLGDSEPGGGWRIWNGDAGSLEKGIIAPFQSFFVRNEQNGDVRSMTIPHIVTTDDVSALYRGSSDRSRVQLAARINGDQVSDTWLSFTNSGSVDQNRRDMESLYPLDYRSFLSMFIWNDGRALDIKNLPAELGEALELPVYVQAWEAASEGYVAMDGEVELIWPVFDNILEDWSITITDTHTGTVTDLREAEGYSFDLSATMNKSATLEHKMAMRSPEISEKNGPEARLLITITPDQPTDLHPGEQLPRSFSLEQNYPNPFNPSTRIRFSLPESSDVRLDVFNIQGQRVATLVNEGRSAGIHTVSFDASNLSSGVYLYRLQAGSQVFTRKMTLIK